MEDQEPERRVRRRRTLPRLSLLGWAVVIVVALIVISVLLVAGFRSVQAVET